MAELDYAFLAEYAKVEGGTLSALGASYTQIAVARLPSQHLLYVAGRVRAPLGENPDLSLTIKSPQGRFELSISFGAPDLSDVRPYDGKVGVLFAANVPIPLIDTGLYQVLLHLDGQQVRRLAFEVEVISAS